jgi:hypothetical protein
VFGSALNAELGHVRYLLFYALAASIAAAGYLLLNDQPAIGASGAICGVTGMVAALYPRNDVRLFYFAWLILRVFFGTVDWPAVAVIVLFFSMDVFFQIFLGELAPVGYMAHISGTLCGFALGIAALKRGWVVSDGHDFLSWYLGTEVKNKRTRPSILPVGAHKNIPINIMPKPAPEWDPIPIVGDEPAEEPQEAPRRPEAEQVRDLAVVNDVPVYRQLSAYFSRRPKAEEIPQEDVDKLTRWYERYRKVHAGVSMDPHALLGLARLFVREHRTELALDAYDRLLRMRPGLSLAALEAARFADFSGKRSRARALVKVALAGELPPERRQAALDLQNSLGSKTAR